MNRAIQHCPQSVAHPAGLFDALAESPTHPSPCPLTETCIYGPKGWDVANLLELLNMELLEARDAELDRRIDEFQELLHKPTERSLPFRTLYERPFKNWQNCALNRSGQRSWQRRQTDW
jgi:hypothetical protein